MEAKENEVLNTEEERFLKAKSDALRLLSFSARSAKELHGRLKQKKYSDEMVDRVIEGFRKQGLVDDEKFAKLFAESRIYSRPTGKKQLAMDLKKKGLSPELVTQTVANLKDYDEKKMVRELALKRLKSMAGISREKKKTRLFGFLKRRGFGNESIFFVLNEVLKGNSTEGLEFRENSNED